MLSGKYIIYLIKLNIKSVFLVHRKFFAYFKFYYIYVVLYLFVSLIVHKI